MDVASRFKISNINLLHVVMSLEVKLSLFLFQDFVHWDLVEPLPSYGRGIELPGGRYRSLITGNNLSDVVITGTDIPLHFYFL